MDRFLGLLGLSLRAGKLAVGEDPTYDALAHGRARSVVLASDASDHTGRKLRAKLGEVPLLTPRCTKEELGRALGRKSCALCAVTDAGLARSLAQHIPPQDPNTTTEVSRFE